LGIVNVVGSTVARKTDAGIFQYAGPEISVATTKAFVSQLAILSLFAIWLGVLRGTLSKRDSKKLLYGLHLLPAKAREILKMSSRIRKIALLFKDYKNFLYVGRKYSLPIALEGALKLKEISYIHAEAYGAGEMKHGPIALINKNFPTVAVVPDDSVYEKTLSNLQEIKARSGPIIAVTFAGDKKIAKLADEVLGVPQTLEQFSPILTIIPLQLFAYYVAVARGCDVDKPRNLAKSVTVE
jgi:glucosamine--fructose-6-phosphate aminotransferase (isomerizing)